jgi:hypothetical protein
MPQQSTYIYGIIREPRPRKFAFTGIGDAGVYIIHFEQLSAVVSDSMLPEIDPTRKNVQAHTIVQEKLMDIYSLLPMGFGMVAGDRDEVRRLLESNYNGLLAELQRLDGKIEVELKVFWDQETVIKELQGESQALSRLRSKVNAASSPVEVRGLLIEAGKLVESIVEDWKSRYTRLVFTILQEVSFEAKVNNPVGIRNLMNASFLIDKSRESEFKEQVYRLDARFKEKMIFKYVGPLPPYNFVNLKLEPVKC